MNKRTKANLAGRKAYNDGTPWAANPYPQGSSEWQDWNNGKGDAGEKDFIRIVKAFPNLLRD